MRIKSIEVAGFKSFADRQRIELEQPVIAIVGPNGCGKSNIVDAIRWTMGEQSIKKLRGKRSHDIIFAGTDSVPPAQSAEVSLVFDNSDKSASADYAQFSEISVKRVLFRDSDSKFYINGKRARLKDITDLFLGTGVGKSAYSIIEQGQIGFIVSARPEERRQIIEEAAGITRYKARRKEAEQKLERTAQNLERVNDMVDELGRQKRSLERQAQKARRYQRLKSELKQLELWVWAKRAKELKQHIAQLNAKKRAESERKVSIQASIASIEAQLAKAEQEYSQEEEKLLAMQKLLHESESETKLLEQGIEHKLNEIEEIRQRKVSRASEIERIRQKIEELEKEDAELSEVLAALRKEHDEHSKRLGESENQLQRAKGEGNRLERDISKLKDKLFAIAGNIIELKNKKNYIIARIDELKHRRNRLQTEVSETQTRYEETKNKLEEHNRILSGIRDELESYTNTLEDAKKKAAKLSNELKKTEEELYRMNLNLSRVESTLESLKSLNKKLEGAPSLLKKVVESGKIDESKMAGLLGTLIEVPEEIQHAVAAAMGQRLNWLVLTDPTVLNSAINIAESAGRGDAGFFLLNEDYKPSTQGPSNLESAKALSEFIKANPKVEALMKLLLDGVFLIESTNEAFEAIKSLPEERRENVIFVTKEGTLIYGIGAAAVVSGESAQEDLLDRSRRIRELSEKLASLKESRKQIEERRNRLSEQFESQQQIVKQTETALSKRRMALMEKEKEVDILLNEARRQEKQLSVVRAEIEQIGKEIERTSKELNEIDTQIKAGAEEEQELQSKLSALQEEFARQQELYASLQDRLNRERMELVRIKERADSADSQLRRIRRELKESRFRLSSLIKGEENEAVRAKNLSLEVENMKKQAAEFRSKAKMAESALARYKTKLESLRTHITNISERLKQNRAELENSTSALHGVELELERIKGEYEFVINNASSKYGEDLNESADQFLQQGDPPEDAETQIAELSSKIDRIGPVNLMALQEFDEVAKRFEFFVEQRSDLEKAVANLKQTISEIDKKSRDRFKASFEEINESFKKVFPRLFGGGKAWLELTNPDDLLETGVDIVARPPGKKPQSISLLSGGEKALTAVSLIFSIFLIKPAPFCVLDEVDAPLDDANVVRVMQLIRELSNKSQFLIITHNKRTMQMVDIIYGVTMEEPGVSKIVSVELKEDYSSQSHAEATV